MLRLNWFVSVALVVVLAQTAAATVVVQNGNFDDPLASTYSANFYVYAGQDFPVTAVTPWTFGGMASPGWDGLVYNTPWGDTILYPSGTQAAFIEGQGTISQTIKDFVAGTFTVSFYAQNSTGFPGEGIQVKLDGTPLYINGHDTLTPDYGTTPYMTTSTTVSEGSHVLSFCGTNSSSAAVAYIDSVSIAGTSTIPEPSTLALVVTGLVALLAYAWRKRR